MNPTPPALSVVIPCYNEELVLDALHERLVRVCDDVGVGTEIVFVNDGSKDGTWGKLNELAARDARMVCVRSLMMVKFMPAGTNFCNSGSNSFTRSTVSMTFASPSLVTKSKTEGSRSKVAAERVLRVPCTTGFLNLLIPLWMAYLFPIN